MPKYIVAVSGGIDSVVLLDMLAQSLAGDLIVAHFDHGIRDDSAEDARFVAALAERYGLPFETRREELGPAASEERARKRRYAFLRELAARHDAKIITAHHADDAAETVAINLHRGTGWRGLAVLDADILRPLLRMSKDTLKEYIRQHGLEWREDSTNQSDQYLRNRIRRSIRRLPPDERQRLLDLRRQQLALKQRIDQEVAGLIGEGPNYSRYFFTHVPKPAALECLRFVTRGVLTRPQLERALLAIKTAAPGTVYDAGSGTTLRFTTRNFAVQLIK